MSRARDLVQEVRELGPAGLLFRMRWELGLRTGLAERLDRPAPPLPPGSLPAAAELVAKLPFDASGVRRVMVPHVSATAIRELERVGAAAANGEIVAFGRWPASYGLPVDWQLNPVSGERWSAGVHWSRALREMRRVGDVKLTWEVARFPHAYHFARAATFGSERDGEFGAALADQIAGFHAANPFGVGLHWNSSQEVVFRLMAWLFALRALGPQSALGRVAPLVARSLYEGAVHVERHIGYAERAVYNNHLLSEAFGLLLAGELLPQAPQAARWRARGLRVLTAQAGRQFYEDGGYIQQSHNYERVAIQVYLWATALMRGSGQDVPGEWTAALARAVDFLHAQQNPDDGRLPNYGANDGALPSPLSTCDYSDFRPTLQAASVAARGERLYDPGPWDEEAAWLVGPSALDAPLRGRRRRSVSFAPTGFHVLRGDDERSFAVLRCGSVRDRFSQIDMLHLDVWWRGQNVLADPGSYLYNGPETWHDHFMRTAAHNTVVVDGRDQMLHHRQFKTLYWTPARLLRFEQGPGWTLVEGEHHGYRRHPGRCIHRRAVLQAGEDVWVVVDAVLGDGLHEGSLQWLGGPFDHRFDARDARLTLATPAGDFSVAVMDAAGTPVAADVIAGAETPPRGWLSRYYGEKVPAPSLRTEWSATCPVERVTLLTGRPVDVHVSVGGGWALASDAGVMGFRISGGRFSEIAGAPPWTGREA